MKVRDYRIKRFVKCIMLLACVICLSLTYSATPQLKEVTAASKSSLLRVGLEGLYYNKDSITIRNSRIVVGYSVNDTYYKEVTLDNGPYSFIPYMEKYQLAGKYSDYQSASTAAESIRKKGKEAYPVLVGKGSWKTAVVSSDGKSDNYTVMAVNNVGEAFLYTAKSSSTGYPQITSSVPDEHGVYAVDLGERQYRGRIEIGRYKGSSFLKAVSIVDIEEYLYGVVPCEMVYSWPEEALKCQAVCSRSYAYTAGFGGDSDKDKPYILCDTTSSQVYKGYGVERKSTTKAVDETRGEVIYYNNEPVRAYYSSTSGGSTENVEDVWESPIGYLRSVPDIYETDPELEPWVKTLDKEKIEGLMNENNIDMGQIKDIRPFVTTESGRVCSVEIIGDSKYVLTGDKLRKIFSLYSTKYKVIKYGDNPDRVAVVTANGSSTLDIGDSYIASSGYRVSKAAKDIEQFVVLTADNLVNYPAKAPDSRDTYYIAGMGYGHGVGMSQSGAKGMAKAGFTYKEILKHYYTEIEVH